MPTRVRSFAKINLGLAIGPVQVSGFHALTTMYQTIALADEVTVSVVSTGVTRKIKCTSNSARVPVDGRNTAVQMIEKALLSLRIEAEIHVHIEKKLPVQGGLGAGSANAAAALIALEAELNQSLPAAERLEIAAKVGSDVPLFLIGGSVLGINRGEEVYPLPDLPQMPCIVVVPPVGVSTPQAFSDWDKCTKNDGFNAQKRAIKRNLDAFSDIEKNNEDTLTPTPDSDRLKTLSRVLSSAFVPTGASGVLRRSQGLAGNPLLALVRTGIENDFEQVVFPMYPSLSALKRELAGPDSGDGSAVYAALSGSGSALFGLYRDARDAEIARERVEKFAAISQPGTQVLMTNTLTRDEYWRQMVIEDQ